jgi:hypothetical protein
MGDVEREAHWEEEPFAGPLSLSREKGKISPAKNQNYTTRQHTIHSMCDVSDPASLPSPLDFPLSEKISSSRRKLSQSVSDSFQRRNEKKERHARHVVRSGHDDGREQDIGIFNLDFGKTWREEFHHQQQPS